MLGKWPPPGWVKDNEHPHPLDGHFDNASFVKGIKGTGRWSNAKRAPATAMVPKKTLGSAMLGKEYPKQRTMYPKQRTMLPTWHEQL